MAKKKGIIEELDEVLDSKVKITFSTYCASGFYGDECKCIKCCEKHGRKYDKVEEHKNYIYAQVMTGESFIVDGVKPTVYIDENYKPHYGKIFKYFYKGQVSS